VVFSSVLFVFLFLPAFLFLYYLSPSRLKNFVALTASLLFYAWGAPELVFYLVIACALDYGASRLMVRCGDRPLIRRRIAGAAIVFNIGLLMYFKYANFFVHELNRVLSSLGRSPLTWSEVALPIGISFFTFHRVSYIADVYRRVTEPARSYADYLLYVVLFPQLIAGPIVRYHEVAGEIAHRKHSLDLVFGGLFRFTLGLGKKVLVANVLGEVADRVFALAPSSVPTSHAWLGIVCYTFQIYFDFSGYSDMALGLAKMIGIHFPENFNLPYISRSITEFWRRWHISLSSFMRDYLYFPLGGNRLGPGRTYFNLWVVFLLSGFWHGASWNFLLWGAYHGLFLVLDRVFWLRTVERLPKLVAMAATFLVVLFGWVLFRSPDLPFACHFGARMLALSARIPSVYPVPLEALAGGRAFFTLAVAAVISFLPSLAGLGALWNRIWAPASQGLQNAVQFACLLLLCLLSLSYLSNTTFNPFIYFRF